MINHTLQERRFALSYPGNISVIHKRDGIPRPEEAIQHQGAEGATSDGGFDEAGHARRPAELQAAFILAADGFVAQDDGDGGEGDGHGLAGRARGRGHGGGLAEEAKRGRGEGHFGQVVGEEAVIVFCHRILAIEWQKGVIGVDGRGEPGTRRAIVEVGTLLAFVPDAVDELIAAIAAGARCRWYGGGFHHGVAGFGGSLVGALGAAGVNSLLCLGVDAVRGLYCFSGRLGRRHNFLC